MVQPEIEARAESPSEKDQNSSIAILDPDESNQKRIFEAANAGLDPRFVGTGLTSAFAPAWSLDGQWIVFGVGSWFPERRPSKATVMRVRRDGSGLHLIVYRVWGEDAGGSRILRLEDRSTRVLTAEYDNPRAGRPTAAASCSPARWTTSISPSTPSRRTTRTSCGSPRTGPMTAVWTADGKIM